MESQHFTNPQLDDIRKVIRQEMGRRGQGPRTDYRTSKEEPVILKESKKAFKEEGLLAAISKFKEISKVQQVARGYKTSKGEFLRGAGLGGIGDLVEKLFDVRASKEEQEAARKRLGYKDEQKEEEIKKKKVSDGQVSAELSMSKELESRLNSIQTMMDVVYKNTSYIKDRLSPKTIDAKEEGGERRQKVSYDPLAPEGEKFRQVEGGGTLKVGKKFQKSATMQAALLGKLVEKEVQKQAGKSEKKKTFKFTDPKEKRAFDEGGDLAAALAASRNPINLLRKEMNQNFAKVFEMLSKIRSAGSGGPGIIDLAKDALIASEAAAAASAGAAAAGGAAAEGGVTAALAEGATSIGTAVTAGSVAMGASVALMGAGLWKILSGKQGKEATDKTTEALKPYGIEPVFKSAKGTPVITGYVFDGKTYTNFKDLPKEAQIVVLAKTGDTRSKASRDAQKEMADHPDVYRRLQESKVKGEKPEVARTWDDLEKEVTKWVADNFDRKSPDREKYLEFFDQLKAAKGEPLTLSHFLASAGANGIPLPDKVKTTQEVPSIPSEEKPAAAPAPAPAPTAAPPAAAPAPAPAPTAAPPAYGPRAEPAPKPALFGEPKYDLVPKTEGMKKLLMPSDTVKDAISQASKAVGVSESIMLSMAKQESGFRPDAKAGTSSASGLFQFIKGTWDAMVSKYSGKFPDLTKGPMDPTASALAGALYIKENSKILEKNGIPVDGTSIYASHFLGPGGAVKLFNSDPSAPAVSVFGDKVANANKHIFFADKGKGAARTISEVQQVLYEKVGKYADQYAAALNGAPPAASSSPAVGAPPSPTGAAPAAAVASTGTPTPTPSTNGAAIDTGTKQIEAGKAQLASTGSAPVVINNNTSNAKSAPAPSQKMPDADTRPSEGSFNRALAKDYSHPTAFTSVSMV